MKKKRIVSVFLRVFLILSLFLSFSACQGLPFDIDLSKLFGINDPTISQTPSETTVPTEAPDLQNTATQSPPPDSLIVWVPPEMDPNGDDPAAELLKAQFEAFSLENGISITVRVKERSGSGGLLDALTATSAAAPDVLPDLIALPRKDLENAALKSLIYPLDDQTETIDDVDWYPYAKELAFIQGSIFGFPFTGDALGVIYRSDVINKTPNTWDALNAGTSKIAFALDDPKANFILTLYQAVGGLVEDNQRRPMIESEPLTEALTFLQDNVDTYAYRELVLQLQNELQVWQAYQNEFTEAAVISVSVFLQNKPGNSAMIPLPPVNDISITTGSGWVWAIATPLAERQAL
ncbi:MAG: hypothetical protein MUO40_03610, partial [Anaerolineaceae bacterium]|nr:hypothetical protein [Anaerolineaceae bacterium]